MFFRFPVATRFPGWAHLRCAIVAAAPGPGRWVYGPAAGVACIGTPGLSHAERPRPAAYIWQTVPKELIPLIDGVGHFLMVQRPTDINKRILEFLAA